MEQVTGCPEKWRYVLSELALINVVWPHRWHCLEQKVELEISGCYHEQSFDSEQPHHDASLEICFIGEGRPEEWLVLCVRCRCQVTEKGRTVTHSTIKFHRCSEELMSEFHSVPMGLRHLLGSWKSVCSKSGNQDGLDNKRWIKTRIFFHTLFLDAYLQATRDWCTLLVLAIVISKRRNNNKTKQKTTQLHIPVLFPLVLLGSVFFASTTFCLVSTCNLYSFSK